MSIESESNGTTQTSVVVDDKSRRHPRWTRQETLSLIQAKEITENSPHKGRKMSSLMVGSMENTEPKWVMISSYCKKQGVKRGPAQCRKRWSNLIGDFRKVKLWEEKVKEGENKGDSFWTMRNDLRKENKLPVSFDVEVFKVLEGRESGAAGAVSPLPLQAVAAGYGDVNEDCEEDEGAEEVEEEMMNNGEREFVDVKIRVLSSVKDDVLSSVKDGVLSDEKDKEQGISEMEWKEEIPKIAENADSVTENPVQNFCNSEPVSEEHQEFQHIQEQNNNSKQDTATDSSKEAEPEPIISKWDSQEKVKRRRLSTDDHRANCSETQILQVLEANNKLLNVQLDNHNKNCQLDREQRKEIKDALVATLGKLTDVLVKLAEKL